MKYDFTCDTCYATEEIYIPTWDIHTKGKHSLAIDQEKLSERLLEPKKCKCGGNLKNGLTLFDKPLFVQVDRQRFL